MDLVTVTLNLFLSEINAEYGDVLYYTEVRRRSSGTMLRLEIEMFMSDKGRIVIELSDEKRC